MSGTTPNIPHVLKKAGFLYDQAGNGGQDLVFAGEALAAITHEYSRANSLSVQRDEARREADAMREKLASTLTLSSRLQEARLLAETRLVEIRDLQGKLEARLVRIQALQVSAGESSSEILRLQDELKAALANNAALSTLTTRLQQELREERAAYMALHQKCRPANWAPEDWAASLASMPPVGRDAGEQFRKTEDRSQTLAYAVADMQEAVHELANLLTLHRRAMDTSLAGGLERILGRLTVTIRQATK